MISRPKNTIRPAVKNNGGTQNDGGIFSVSEKPDHVFIAAQRHSRRVQLLKIVLPAIALVIAGIFSWFTFFSTSPARDIITLNTEISEDGRMTMTQPKIEGYTKTNQPYFMKAGRAVQDPSQNGLIELQDIVAEIPLARRGRATVNAVGGFYDNINGRLWFDKPFTVTTSDGMTARFQSADINIETSQINTTNPVDINRDNQHLTANAMQVKENGALIVFSGNVRLVIDN